MTNPCCPLVILSFAPAFLPIDRGLDQNPVNRLWVSHTLANSVLSNAILFFAAVHVDFLYKRRQSVVALYYHGKTICHLNEALSSLDMAVSDPVVAAVALLVAAEVRMLLKHPSCRHLLMTFEIQNVTGAVENITLHMNALKRMVEMRGGLANLGWRGTLHMFISWCVQKSPPGDTSIPYVLLNASSRQDLIASTTTNSPPLFTYSKTVPPAILPHSHFYENNYSVPYITLGIPSFDILTGSYCDISAILFEIRHLTLIVESFNRSRGATPPEMLAFSKARSELEYRLLSIPSPIEFIDRPEQYLYEVCRVTATIYINYVLHEFDPVFGVLRKLKRKLLAVMQAREEKYEDLRGPSNDVVLLWVLFMGGLIAENFLERTWFAKRIAKIVQRLGLRSWEETEGCLMKALWIRRMRDDTCESLWMAVRDYLEIFNLPKIAAN